MARRTAEIREFITENVRRHPQDITLLTSSHFGISKSAVSRHLRNLLSEGILIASGSTRDRKFELRKFVTEYFKVDIVPELEENVVWLDQVAPLLEDVPQNVKELCQYVFTEIMNNAMDHSRSNTVEILINRDAANIEMFVIDYGIGIFAKLQEDFSYIADSRHAAFELSKGRLTSDNTKHTGLGIFFASRMCDDFTISSEDVAMHRRREKDTWILEQEEEQINQGTQVLMRINPKTPRTTEQVFSRFGSDSNSLAFIRTHVPLSLLRYEGEELVSRSQAKRLLVHINRFEEALLDFSGIRTIGHSFADEIFRVYKGQHPNIKLLAINATPEVLRIINSVRFHSEAGLERVHGSS